MVASVIGTDTAGDLAETAIKRKHKRTVRVAVREFYYFQERI